MKRFITDPRDLPHLRLFAQCSALFIPAAAVVHYCSQRWPLEGGVYQWTRHVFGPFGGFDPRRRRDEYISVGTA